MNNNLIGHAGELAALLPLTLASKDRIKLLFNGPPGIGKSDLSRRLATDLCGGKWGIEEIIGRKATIHHVSRWEEEFATSCMFGSGRKIRIINEIDTMPRDALDAMLAFLDDMPAGRGIIGTTNLPFAELPERFRSRFTRYEVRAPSVDEIKHLLIEREGLPPAVAEHIAGLSGGNVRGAIMDADAWRSENKPERRPIEIQGSLAALGI